MKILEQETYSSGHRVYRLAGKKILSMKCKRIVPVKRKGAPVLVIRRDGDVSGLFCHFTYNLGWMRWAEEHGYKCYVDMRTPSNIFTRTAAIDFNPWDLYFKQTCDATDLIDARKVMTTTFRYFPPQFPGVFLDLYDQDNPEFQSWRKFTHEHIRLSDEMAKTVDAQQDRLFTGEERILGCLVRGTDYTAMKPARHPVQPTPQQVIEDARRICEERNLRKVFLATEDAKARDLFEQAFGSDLIMNQTDLPDYKGSFLARSGALGDLAQTLRISTQYLVSVVLLSRCPCLLAGCASGSMGAALLSKGFELMKVYNLGTYGETANDLCVVRGRLC